MGVFHLLANSCGGSTSADDDSILDQCSTADSIGEIRLVIDRVKIGEDTEFVLPSAKKSLEGKVHERSKKLGGHRVTYFFHRPCSWHNMKPGPW